MKEIDLDWKVALRVWWSYTWRCLVIILPATFVVGGIIGFVVGAMGGQIEENALWLQVMGGVISMVLSFMILRDVLAKRYKHFRIAVIACESEEDKPGIQPSI